MSEDDPRFQFQRQGAKMAEPSTEHDFVARQIADAAFMVHGKLGPGPLASVCQQSIASDLKTTTLPAAGRTAFRPERLININIAVIKHGIRRRIKSPRTSDPPSWRLGVTPSGSPQQ